jgi:hypothetical protein
MFSIIQLVAAYKLSLVSIKALFAAFSLKPIFTNSFTLPAEYLGAYPISSF